MAKQNGVKIKIGNVNVTLRSQPQKGTISESKMRGAISKVLETQKATANK
ncbi:MAG: hypothetical protein OJI67_12195 [Prosthecobacter sp.]|nr:hypothetical protein [Prosthecobacter sp.]